MKFRCERDVLADALITAGRAATSRTGTLPVLSGLRLEVHGDELVVVGTDLELSIRLTVKVGGEDDGAVVVPARLVAEIVRSLPVGAVEVGLVGEELSISAGRSQFVIRPLSLDDYPVQAEPSTDAVTLPSSAVAEALRQVVRAASTDDARAVLTGVLIAAEEDGVRMVATDSYRLAVRDLPENEMLAGGQKVLVPSRALNELQRVLATGDDLRVRLGQRDAVFETGSTRLTTRLIEGDYPNYRNLLPSSYPNVLTVGREALLEALRRVKLLAQDATPVRLALGGETLQLTAITQDVGNASEEIDATYEGSEMTVAFNPDYLAAGVDAVDTEEITLSTLDPMKPAGQIWPFARGARSLAHHGRPAHGSVIIERLELVDFRNYREAVFTPTTGTTLVVGDNGQGKTNLVEAIAYLATLTSFRGAPPEALVRTTAPRAVLRANVLDEDGRTSLIEAELAGPGRNRVQVNRQRLARARDLLGVVRVTVFSPDDLALVKRGPAGRRRYLDDTLVALAVKHDAGRLELDRIVRQRNVLLRQTRGRLDEDAERTLDVWDQRLVDVGERFGHARAALVVRLDPFVVEAYAQLAGSADGIALGYDPAWRRSGLAAALAEARPADLRLGVSTVGPHRDELDLTVGELPARTHASQGEQRTLALSLRLAAHRLVAERTGSTPVLVLDDVLSELDPGHATALLEHLPDGQIIITTAGEAPAAVEPERVLRVITGELHDGVSSRIGF